MSQSNRIPCTVILSCAVLAGCDDIQQSPKLIEADGQTYLACQGFVWVSREGGGLFGGGGTFKVTFTDAAGLSHTLRGLKQVNVSDLPSTRAPMGQAAVSTETLTPEDERLLALYSSGSTSEERARISAGMTASEKQQLTRAFIKRARIQRTAPAAAPDPCAGTGSQ
jgi:hypothetical protein